MEYLYQAQMIINVIIHAVLWLLGTFLLYHGMRLCFQFPENKKYLKENVPWIYNASLLINKALGAFYIIAGFIGLCILHGISL